MYTYIDTYMYRTHCFYVSFKDPHSKFLTWNTCILLHIQNTKRFLEIRKNLNLFLKCSLFLYPKLNTKEILQCASEWSSLCCGFCSASGESAKPA